MTMRWSAVVRRLFAVLLLGLMAGLAAAADTDHPALSRMAGFEISSRQVKPFDVVEPSAIGKMAPGQPNTFEGKVTEIEYVNVTAPSTEIMIYRNYLAAVQKAGGKQLNIDFNPNDRVTHNTGSHVFALPGKPSPVIVLLDIKHGGAYRLTFIEPKPMLQSVTAGQLAQEIQNKGFATLYINFDSNKAELKPDGTAAVAQIVALLKQDRSLKLSIEGHTDNVGNAAANKKLSQARADAVMQAVIAGGTSASRLSAKGFGQEVPVADNRTEEGRAKNRRVELVRVK